MAGTSWRRIATRNAAARHHRALDTIGRLSAQHGEHDRTSGRAVDPGARSDPQAHVRLLRGDDPGPGDSVPPQLRSRPRRLREAAPPEHLERNGHSGAPPPIITMRFDDLRHVAAAEADGGPGEPAPAATAPPAAKDARARRRAFGRARRRLQAGLRAGPAAAQRLRTGLGSAVAAVPRHIEWTGRALIAVAAIAAAVLAAGLAGVATLGGASAPGTPAARAPLTTLAAPAPSVPPATTPAPALPALVASSSGYAAYKVSWPATIRVDATGTCWVEIRNGGPSGQVAYQGDLHAGESRTLTGPSWVRFGYPQAVAVGVDGEPLRPPAMASGSPADLQFE
ncbi:MAG: DUF4115 domain-containing protein [Acidimicrobiales bacterium]